jgi:hypothetical protein
MIAAVTSSDARVVLIDEPEAFLHPTLCTTLAHELCRKAAVNQRQLMVATHSAPFLFGCVQSGVDMNVVRLTFRNGIATSRLMDYEELVPLMRNPLLRSTGALSGVFFESVIVTEAETDRAFYEEINRRCMGYNHDGGVRDCLFINAKSWQTTKIIGPLRRLGVAAAAIVDIDFFCEEASTAFQALLMAANVPETTRTSLGQMRGSLRPRDKKDNDSLKKKGVDYYINEQRNAIEDFISQLAQYGIFVVPCGELENWLPHLSRPTNYKSDWLENTFSAMGEDAGSAAYVKPTEGDVWDFFKKIKGWLHDPNKRGIPYN